MKKIAAATLFALFLTIGGYAQDDSKWIVNEYFLNIPEEFLKGEVRQRASWIDDDDAEQGNLTFSVPAAQFIDDEDIDATIFGVVQLFPKDKGGMIVALAVNVCIERTCNGTPSLA